MTVKELKAMLAELGSEVDNCQVIMSCDAEGNHYSPVSGLEDTCYCEDSKHYYIDSLFSDQFTPEENGFESKEEWEKYKRENDRVVVLFPVN